MGLVSTVYFGTTLLEKMGVDVDGLRDKFTEMVQGYATNIVNNIEPETINARLAEIEIDADLTPEEIEARNQTLESFKAVIDAAGGEENNYQNIIDAIDQDPERWGQVLVNAHVDAEVLANMQTSIENGESVTWDLVKLAYGSTSGAFCDFTEKYADGPVTEQEEVASVTNEANYEAANEVDSKTKSTTASRYDMAMSMLNVPSGNSETQFGE